MGLLKKELTRNSARQVKGTNDSGVNVDAEAELQWVMNVTTED